MTTEGAVTEPVVIATVAVEAYYEYPQAKGWGATEKLGHNRITDPEDPRWDDELMKAPYKGNPHGYLNVAEVTRVNGEVVRSRGICGYSYHKNKAQEFLREFARLKDSGSKTPWDTERHYRDTIASYEAAKNEGRVADFESLKQALAQAFKTPGVVSPGSPVKQASSVVRTADLSETEVKS